MSTAYATQAVHLHWSRWFHCESSFSLSLVPNKPGIFAIAESVESMGAESSCGDGSLTRPEAPGRELRRVTLNIVQVRPASDLFQALNRLYAQDAPERDQLEKHRCFIRYAAIDEPGLRDAVAADLQQWLDSPGESDSPFVTDFQRAAGPEDGPYRTKGD